MMDPEPKSFTVFFVMTLKMDWFVLKVMQTFVTKLKIDFPIKVVQVLITDPDLKFTLVDQNMELVFSFKVVLALKRKRFGQAWPEIFRLQAEALWPEGFWWVPSSNGGVLLGTFSVDIRVYSSVMDRTVLQYKTFISEDFTPYEYEWEIMFLFQDSNVKERGKGWMEFFYWFYSYKNGGNISLGLHGGIGGFGSWLDSRLGGWVGGGGVNWRREHRGLEVGRDALIRYGIGVVELEETGFILNSHEGSALINLEKIQVLTVNLVAVHQPGSAQLGDSILEVAVRLCLQTPDRQLGPGLAVLQPRGQEIKVGRAGVDVEESVNVKNVNEKLFLTYSKWDTYLATMGDLILAVCLETFPMKHGGILMFKWREVKSIRMSTSFSPGRRFGTEGPAKTSDLKFGNTIHSCLIIFLLPNTVGTLQGQKLGVGLLLVVGHGPGQGVLPLTQALNLLGQVLNLSLDIGHVSWFMEDTMEISNGGIFMFQGHLEFPKEKYFDVN